MSQEAKYFETFARREGLCIFGNESHWSGHFLKDHSNTKLFDTTSLKQSQQDRQLKMSQYIKRDRSVIGIIDMSEDCKAQASTVPAASLLGTEETQKIVESTNPPLKIPVPNPPVKVVTPEPLPRRVTNDFGIDINTLPAIPNIHKKKKVTFSLPHQTFLFPTSIEEASRHDEAKQPSESPFNETKNHKRPSESSEVLNETHNHNHNHNKRLRRAQTIGESNTFHVNCEFGSNENIPSQNIEEAGDIDQAHLGFANFHEVSYTEYRSHILNKLTSYVAALKFLQSERSAFRRKMKHQSIDLMALTKKVNTLDMERASLQEELLKKDEFIEKIDRKHIQDLQNAQKTLLSHEAAKRSFAKQKTKYKNKLRSSNQIIVALQKEIEELVKKNTSLGMELKDCKDQIYSMNQYVCATDQSNVDMETELSRLRHENKVLKQNLQKEKIGCGIPQLKSVVGGGDDESSKEEQAMDYWERQGCHWVP